MEDAYHEILTRPLRGTGLSFNGAQRLEHRAAARAALSLSTWLHPLK